jgi:sulfur transfer complex TusBCD TusB component (DsrH family)
MRVLFVILGFQKVSTVFDAAERMAEREHEVQFLFVHDGCRHVVDPELMGSMSYAEGVYCMEKDYVSEGLHDRSVGVMWVDYSGWVELLEQCDRLVSWS